MHGLKLEPGHATMPVDCALRKSSGTFFPVIQRCDHVPAGPGGDSLVIDLSRTTPQQDPS